MKTVVVTGGPCSGKTSAIDLLQKRLAREGVPAVFVAEAATDLIGEGISPISCGSMKAFQTKVTALQIVREATAKTHAESWEAQLREEAASEARHEDASREVLVVCDRGICDGDAYLDHSDFLDVLAENGLSFDTVMQRYDAVFCLESTAHLGTEAYTVQNNAARSETASEAAALDLRTHAAWEAHPGYCFVSNEDTFMAKAEKLCDGILALV